MMEDSLAMAHAVAEDINHILATLYYKIRYRIVKKRKLKSPSKTLKRSR